jgi:hypothetical protein
MISSISWNIVSIYNPHKVHILHMLCRTEDLYHKPPQDIAMFQKGYGELEV